jgi:hypothetical protein
MGRVITGIIMEIVPVQYVSIELHNEPEHNEVATFCGLVLKCYAESINAGFNNMFTEDERGLIKQFMEGLNIVYQKENIVPLSADTHTREQ